MSKPLTLEMLEEVFETLKENTTPPYSPSTLIKGRALNILLDTDEYEDNYTYMVNL